MKYGPRNDRKGEEESSRFAYWTKDMKRVAGEGEEGRTRGEARSKETRT